MVRGVTYEQLERAYDKVLRERELLKKCLVAATNEEFVEKLLESVKDG